MKDKFITFFITLVVGSIVLDEYVTSLRGYKSRWL